MGTMGCIQRFQGPSPPLNPYNMPTQASNPGGALVGYRGCRALLSRADGVGLGRRGLTAEGVGSCRPGAAHRIISMLKDTRHKPHETHAS